MIPTPQLYLYKLHTKCYKLALNSRTMVVFIMRKVYVWMRAPLTGYTNVLVIVMILLTLLFLLSYCQSAIQLVYMNH